jgi:thiamine pyrophosphate-dependent acetolactate synthase large subunit-like protein
MAADALLGAERPVILAGRGARLSGAADALRELGDRVGAVLATTLLAKGYFRDDPYDLGVVGLFASDLCQELVSQADVVLAVGASLNHYTTESGVAFPFARVIRIDDQPNLPRDGIAPIALHLQADARAGVEALLDAVRGRAGSGYRTADLARRIAAHDPLSPALDRAYETGGLLDPRAVMRHVDSKLSADDITVIGMGHFWWFAINFLRSRADDSFIFTHDFGAIGQGIATGIGAAIGRPDRRVTIIEGDASALMAIQELDTAVRYGVPIRVLVMNDEGVGAEYHHLQSIGLDPRDSILPSPDLALVARGFGANGITLDSPELLARRLDDEWDHPGPALFDVRISREVMSEPNRKLWYPTLQPDEPA